jgi:AcrR family transcriptional regulator
MGKTQDRIIQGAIELFNQRGFGVVRVHDIAKYINISPGNLTYHFKTKKELMQGVFQEIKDSLKEMKKINQNHVENGNWGEVLRMYFHFQLKYRFFNRDILDIVNSMPSIKSDYQKQLKQIIGFSLNSLQVYVEKGYMKPEAHEGQYLALVQNGLSIMTSWLIHWEVLGDENIDITGGVHSVVELYYPYFTEKGLPIYYKNKSELPFQIKEDLKKSKIAYEVLVD